MRENQLKKSILNSFVGILITILLGVLQFKKIGVINQQLGIETYGLNSLYSSLVSFLLISESGLILATTTSLYFPIARGEIEKINSIIHGSMVLMRKIILLIIFGAVVVSFIIPLLINGNTYTVIYIFCTFVLFVLKATIPLYLQPIKGYVAASNNEYIIKIISFFSLVIVTIIEIIIITISKNYLFSIFIAVLLTLISEVTTFFYLRKRFKQIVPEKYFPDFEAKNHMNSLLKISIVSTVARSLDSIILSIFLGLSAVGIYANYNNIVMFLLQSILAGLNGFSHFFGNQFVTKKKNSYLNFKRYIIFTNYIASIVSILFLINVKTFISLWISPKAVGNDNLYILFTCILYFYIAIKPMNVLVTTNQFFKLASKSAIYETLLNLVGSIFLVSYLGIGGVLLATLIAFIFASFWYFPLKTYKVVFEESSSKYFLIQIRSVLILLVVLFFLNSFISINMLMNWNQFIYFLLKSVFIVFLILSFIYYLIDFDFRYIVKSILRKFMKSSLLRGD